MNEPIQVFAGDGINTDEMFPAHFYVKGKPLANPVKALIPYDDFKRLEAATKLKHEKTVTLYRWHGSVTIYHAKLVGHQFIMETGEIRQVDVQGVCHTPDFILRSENPDADPSL